MDRLEDTLRRLRDERDDADRRYNDALTALDQALTPAPRLPAPPPAYDESQVTPLNDAWNILATPPPGGGGIAGKLRGLIWRTIAPYLQQQLTFNSRLVDHVNRNAVPHRETHSAIQEVLAAARERAARDAEFQSRLIVLLQQITAYVDTRDREAGGGALVLNAAQSAMAEEFAKRWESRTAQEAGRVARHEARVNAVAADIADVRTAAAAAQQAAMAVKRAMEQRQPDAGRADTSAPRETVPGVANSEEIHGALNAYKYVGFENQFRGPRELIRARLESYLPLFAAGSDVLDIGCGRGEFLELLQARGVRARGLDLNQEMVAECRSRGLEAQHGDAVSHLASLPDGALGGLFAAQVVEHLEPEYLLRFIELAFHKLRPGGLMVLETINPACWVAFFESYIRDITHRWPLHPDTLKYFVLASGFTTAEIEWRSPVDAQHRLQSVPVPPDAAPPLQDLVEAFNGNVDKLNARIFTHMDYAIVGRR